MSMSVSPASERTLAQRGSDPAVTHTAVFSPPRPAHSKAFYLSHYTLSACLCPTVSSKSVCGKFIFMLFTCAHTFNIRIKKLFRFIKHHFTLSLSISSQSGLCPSTCVSPDGREYVSPGTAFPDKLCKSLLFLFSF